MEWKTRKDFDEEYFGSIEKNFGKRLRYVRVTLGITQEELAFRSGLNRNYISDTERGKRNISLFSISRLATGLEVDVYQLFIFDDNE